MPLMHIVDSGGMPRVHTTAWSRWDCCLIGKVWGATYQGAHAYRSAAADATAGEPNWRHNLGCCLRNSHGSHTDA
jgi:hypothetical protein